MKFKQLYSTTPLIEETIPLIPGKKIYYKMEAFQPCGSFKLRGIQTACKDAIENGADRLLASSGGNAGLAVAYVGKNWNIPTTVVLPDTTPGNVIEELKRMNAEVIIKGHVWDEAIAAGGPVTIDGITSVAKSLGAQRVAEKAFENTTKFNIISHLVTDESACRACAKFADEHRMLVEPACGASLCVIYDNAKITQEWTAMLNFTDYDSFLLHEGTNYEIYKKLGAHPDTENGVSGTRFLLWAPNAQYVSLITARTGWENENWMHRTSADSGIWECFLPGVGDGDAYRYIITGADGVRRWKSDPVAFRAEQRPQNASIVCSLDTYTWEDEKYQKQRDNTKVLENPMCIYEVHLGSWKKAYENESDEDGFLNYRQLGEDLAEYALYMGYTHIELMGICEYPFDLSWGVPGNRIFCTDQPLRNTGRFQIHGRSSSQKRHRHHTGLGSRSFPKG